MQVRFFPDNSLALVAPLKNSCEKNGESRQRGVVNANYEKVMSAIYKLLQEERYSDACRCSDCISNMAAMALNYLPPHYYVETETGKENEIGSPWIMVESAVLEAIETVKKNKNHQM